MNGDYICHLVPNQLEPFVQLVPYASLQDFHEGPLYDNSSTGKAEILKKLLHRKSVILPGEADRSSKSITKYQVITFKL